MTSVPMERKFRQSEATQKRTLSAVSKGITPPAWAQLEKSLAGDFWSKRIPPAWAQRTKKRKGKIALPAHPCPRGRNSGIVRLCYFFPFAGRSRFGARVSGGTAPAGIIVSFVSLSA